jgi:formate dehydrogenase
MKVLAALYEDPKGGYPPVYARDTIPDIKVYPDGQTTPTPKSASDYNPGDMLGCMSGELGLRKFLEDRGHELVVVNDKDTPGGEFEKELPSADIVISQPFWPVYMTEERIKMAPNLKMVMTAGIGSDHCDLQAAMDNNLTVTEVTFCNSISVAEHVVMQILALVRNLIPSHEIIKAGGWNIADSISRSYDVEGMTVGTVAAGRIGLAVLKRMQAFDCDLQYTDRHRLSDEIEATLTNGATGNPVKFQGGDSRADVERMVQECDVITINCPLYPATEHMFDRKMLELMPKGSYIVNTARGKICDAQAIADALESGHLAGYAGDVWFPQPPPPDHVWRTMPYNAMTPHMSGTSLSAQHRYCAGVRETLECFFDNEPIRDEYLVVQNGALAGVGAHSYSEGSATGGSEKAVEGGNVKL